MKNCCHWTYLPHPIAVKRIVAIAIAFVMSLPNSFKIIALSLFDRFWRYHFLGHLQPSLGFCCSPCLRLGLMVHSDLILINFHRHGWGSVPFKL